MTESRLYPERPFLAVSIAVFRGDRVLLMARAAAPFSQTFTLPGGIVEVGETLEEACLRELAEETGVRAEVIGFNDHATVIEHDGESRVRRHFVIASFVGVWVSGEGAVSAEAAEVRWIPPHELGGLALTPRLGPILARAREIVEARRCGG
jgi:8-oxo-dGTP diphosphatase